MVMVLGFLVDATTQGLLEPMKMMMLGVCECKFSWQICQLSCIS